MAENFNIEIISPELKLLAEKVNSVTIPGYEGDMTILKDHIPVITFLRPGIIEVLADKERKYFVEEGTVEFSENKLIILSSMVIDIKNLSKEKISKMIEEAKNQIAKEDLDDKRRYIISLKLDCL